MKKDRRLIFIHLSSRVIIIIMSSSPSNNTTNKVFASSPALKTVLFGVLASTVIASFAFASENAHILLQQVRKREDFDADSTRFFSDGTFFVGSPIEFT